MLEQVTRFFTGYAEFEVQGDTARFLNITTKSGHMLWEYQKDGDVLRANIRAAKYKKLRAVKRRTGVKMYCVKKVGLPFYLWRARKRTGLFIGAAIFVLLYSFLSGGVWDVRVSGNENLTDAQILNAAKEIGIYEGVRRSSIDSPAAALKLSRELESLSWVSVNTDRSTVIIEVKEAEEKPEITTEETPCNIIAKREGQIISIEAASGMQQVKIGDVVQTGQVLISGSYTEPETPYIEKQAPIKSYLVAARGVVRAETVHEFSVEVPLQKQMEIETEEKANRYLMFFGIKIPLGLNSSPDGIYHSYQDNDMLTVLDQELPIGILTETYSFYAYEDKTLTQEEWEREALYQLREVQNLALEEGSVIIEETLEYEYTEDTCILSAYCRVEEEIGVEQEISFEFPNES